MFSLKALYESVHNESLHAGADALSLTSLLTEAPQPDIPVVPINGAFGGLPPGMSLPVAETAVPASLSFSSPSSPSHVSSSSNCSSSSSSSDPEGDGEESLNTSSAEAPTQSRQQQRTTRKDSGYGEGHDASHDDAQQHVPTDTTPQGLATNIEELQHQVAVLSQKLATLEAANLTPTFRSFRCPKHPAADTPEFSQALLTHYCFDRCASFALLPVLRGIAEPDENRNRCWSKAELQTCLIYGICFATAESGFVTSWSHTGDFRKGRANQSRPFAFWVQGVDKSIFETAHPSAHPFLIDSLFKQMATSACDLDDSRRQDQRFSKVYTRLEKFLPMLRSFVADESAFVRSHEKNSCPVSVGDRLVTIDLTSFADARRGGRGAQEGDQQRRRRAGEGPRAGAADAEPEGLLRRVAAAREDAGLQRADGVGPPGVPQAAPEHEVRHGGRQQQDDGAGHLPAGNRPGQQDMEEAGRAARRRVLPVRGDPEGPAGVAQAGEAAQRAQASVNDRESVTGAAPAPHPPGSED